MKRLKIVALVLTVIATSSCKDTKQETSSEIASEEKTQLKKEKDMKILFVLTSHDQLGDTGKKTGFWVEEFSNPNYTLIDK
jgi:hypothetical protein